MPNKGGKKKGKRKAKPSIKKSIGSTNSSFKNEESSKLRKEIISSNLKVQRIKNEIRKVVIGQDKVINDLIACLLCEPLGSASYSSILVD